MKRKPIRILALIGLMACLTGCMGSSTTANAVGGELIGVRGTTISEPTPYGMVAVNKGSLKVGLAENDTLWGAGFPAREISVDGFGWTNTRLATQNTDSLYTGCVIALFVSVWQIRLMAVMRLIR
jgi:hypothetical protein